MFQLHLGFLQPTTFNVPTSQAGGSILTLMYYSDGFSFPPLLLGQSNTPSDLAFGLWGLQEIDSTGADLDCFLHPQ